MFCFESEYIRYELFAQTVVMSRNGNAGRETKTRSLHTVHLETNSLLIFSILIARICYVFCSNILIFVLICVK